jgi:multidrug efflux system outer membrane protein
MKLMNSERMNWGLSLFFLAVLLAGCATSLPKIEPERLPPTPAAFKEGDGRWTQAPPAEAQPRG